MTEHTFAIEPKTKPTTEPGIEAEDGLVYRELCDELRTHSTEWVRAHRAEVVREQRRLRVWELAATRVLDERGVGPEPEPGVSVRAARETLEVARGLEAMPAIARVAGSGALSWDQLKGVVEVVTPATEVEWAERAPRWAPVDLQREARAAKVVTAEDAAARREARELRCWSEPDAGMVAGRFRLPDVDGVSARRCSRRSQAWPFWGRIRSAISSSTAWPTRSWICVRPTRMSRRRVGIAR